MFDINGCCVKGFDHEAFHDSVASSGESDSETDDDKFEASVLRVWHRLVDMEIQSVIVEVGAEV